jgi:ATP-dependent RNA helicase SUPV3L1/SUV3
MLMESYYSTNFRRIIMDLQKINRSINELMKENNRIRHMINNLEIISEKEEKAILTYRQTLKNLYGDYRNNKRKYEEMLQINKASARKQVVLLQQKLTPVERIEKTLSLEDEEIDKIQLIASEKVWANFSRKNKITCTFEELIENKKRKTYCLKHGAIDTYIIKYVPTIVSSSIRSLFPPNPKDEYNETRLIKRNFTIHEGPTNSGKTYQSIEALINAKTGLYLGPLRLLALEIYDKLNSRGVSCNLLTGEEEIKIQNSRHVSSTVEKADFHKHYDVIVIDECQMIADTERGNAWASAILGVKAPEIHLCCSNDATDLLVKMIEDCQDDYEIVTHTRETALIVQNEIFNFPRDVKEGDALIVFSRYKVLAVAAALEEKKIACSLIYGNLPPETRKLQFESFLNKANTTVVSTDAIGMGVNLPIKRIVFLEGTKFDGTIHRDLLPTEIKQIAGRAGRRGIYDQGYVACTDKQTKNNITTALESNFVPLEKAYIGPNENIIKAVGPSLEEKLKVWADIELEVPYYIKIDIKRHLYLLNYIKLRKYTNKLNEDHLLRIITIPFDETEDELLFMWDNYIYETIQKYTKLSKPNSDKSSLAELELYYKQVGLYYSFSKTLGFLFDEEFVKTERREVSIEINKYLKNNIVNHRRKCKICKRPIPWDCLSPICQKCSAERIEERQSLQKYLNYTNP